jgi:L,D-peptidoglycan transpeptidase YkuD (ErfK/YbiS/YcfS/YnhG family)
MFLKYTIQYFIFSIFFFSFSLQNLSDTISKTKTAQTTSQIILVVQNQLYFFEKVSNNNWEEILSTDCNIGLNGMILDEDHREGQSTTPIGAYPLLYSFGTKKMSDLQIQFRQITPYSYCVDDVNDKRYNSWTESKEPVKGEHLIEYPIEYQLAAFIGFNVKDKVKGKGSCIFLHIKSIEKNYTHGCVAISKQMMSNVLNLLKNNAYIIMVENEEQILNY